MKREQNERIIRDSINRFEGVLSNDEKNLILHNTLSAYDDIPNNSLDSFRVAGILVEAYLDVFRNDYDDIKDKITRNYVNVTNIRSLDEKNILESAIDLGLSITERPVIYQRVSRTEVIEKTLESAKYDELFENFDMKEIFYHKFCSIVHNRRNMGFNDLPMFYHEIYSVALNNKYAKLRQSCESDKEFHEKYGRNSEYQKHRVKVKVLGGKFND